LLAYDHYGKRSIEDFPICGKRCFIEFRQSVIYCTKCNKIVSEKLSFVAPSQHQSIRFQRFFASLCDYMPVTDVAELTGIGKDPLYRIDKLYLKERHEKFCSDNDVTYLGIDEIAIRKVHRYAVVFYDLRRGQVIGLERGRRRIDTSRFFKK
jgi:transposase